MLTVGRIFLTQCSEICTIEIFRAKKYIDKEPPIQIASNLCTAVGRDKNKEFRGKKLYVGGKGE